MDKLALEKDIHSAGMIILGELEVNDGDPVPKEAQSILLLGPDEPNFWKIFKGPKLTKISPNKTYSGAIGSLIMPVFAGLLYIQYFELPLGVIVPIKLDAISNNFDLTFLIMTLSISIISQLGDLTISYFKRLSKIKDTGKILTWTWWFT